MKKAIIVFVVLLGVLNFTAFAQETDGGTAEEILNEYSRIYSAPLQNGVDSLDDVGLDEIMPYFDINAIMNDAAMGRLELNPYSVLKFLFNLLGKEIYVSFKVMVMILVLAVMCSLLTNLGDNFTNNNAGQIAFFACYILIVGVALGAFYGAVSYGQTAVDNMVRIMQISLMLIAAGLMGSGAVVTANMLQPTALISIGVAVTVIKNVFIPLLMLASAISVVNNLSDKFNAQKLAELLNKIIKWGMGAMLTVFVGIIGIQSVGTSGFDGISAKVVKYASSNFVPVVGGILAETVETVMGCSVVIKNAAGITGIIIILIIAAIPLLKLAAHLLIFRLSGAVIQPIADNRIVGCISCLADSISMMFAIVASVAVMFIIMLTVMMNAGNTATMLSR